MQADIPVFDFRQGTAPLLISIPHMGTDIPAQLAARMTPEARLLADTDWHLGRLYDFAAAMGASVIQAGVSRYVVDLNRPPSDESLYPGQTTTSLCPTETFRGEPVYLAGEAPDADEIAARVETYWRPYHDTMRAELERLREAHGTVLLWDAHSIASHLPRLFDGKLPDFNLGTNGGASCSPVIQSALAATAERAAGDAFTWVVNGRFKGGFITRHYGEPSRGIHAVQLEMCQSAYMDETLPFGYRQDLAVHAAPVVRQLIDAALVAATGELQRM
ncbi:N-formylglutamate deformylase [Pandoraea terrae]|uniref:N-formylglutamate deformylase n=1 Tax=Pandoraea terrae TaxID=1537710 RepID=A0A5E4ZCN0_9BURK|nr:N-formylglutamate deformylase [Pandoraea terrae]VVE58786.1 N-formylglutamate deformylase [Pandoraea terrae]